jgi:hypothetical protein
VPAPAPAPAPARAPTRIAPLAAPRRAGITPPGQNCVNYGDKRNPANMCLSEELANELAVELCDDHYVHISDSEVAARPVELRGIPWGLPPGASAALEHLDGAYAVARAVGEYSDDFVAEILVLPLSPYAHQVAADCKPGEFDGAGYRWCTSPRRDGEAHPAGRSYNPDTTDDDAAIGYSRWLRRPSKNDPYDNPFANPGDEVQAAKAMVGYLAALARMCPVAAWECDGDTTARGWARARVRALHEALGAYHAPPRTAAETALVWLRRVKAAKAAGADPPAHPSAMHHVAARAAVALNAIHPSTWEINRPMIQPSLARAATLCKQAHVAQLARGETETGAPLSALLECDDIAEAREWWSAYDREGESAMCAWRAGIAPILEQVLVEDGSHDVRREQLCRMRDLLATLAGPTAFLVIARRDASGAWRAPIDSPLAEVRAPEEVRCDHVNPIFVKRFHDEVPRGGVFGMKRFQLRQLMVALEAGHLDVHAQVFRLQGQMAHRISSDPSVYEQGGKPKSDKACSMVAQDRGHLAFGTIPCRRATCIDQRMSWDSNVRVMRNALLRVAPPASYARRQHGRAGRTATLQREARLCDQNLTRSSDEDRANELFELASTHPAAALANGLLAARAVNQDVA